ncbi:MAG: hypothetical protein ABI314_00860 [Gemmatimonadaceae bacterium]
MEMKQQRTDFPAALTGLVVGGAFVFVILYGIVVLTNHHYAAEATASTSTPAAATK